MAFSDFSMKSTFQKEKTLRGTLGYFQASRAPPWDQQFYNSCFKEKQKPSVKQNPSTGTT
jgi:hypothetical protein